MDTNIAALSTLMMASTLLNADDSLSRRRKKPTKNLKSRAQRKKKRERNKHK